MSTELSHFTEKSGVVSCHTPWGRWWQTVHEVYVEVNLPENVKSKDISVNVKTTEIECKLNGEVLFKGQVPGPLHPDETVWTVEDEWLLNIVLAKADHAMKDEMWPALIVDDPITHPDVYTLHEMRKKLDLERFQIENPGMDFSNAKLSKHYDRLPGWSLQQQSQDKHQHV